MKNWRVFFILGGFALGGMLSYSAVAANGQVIINEIGGYATSTHEWIEIWNLGPEPVDLTGWKFWEAGANHGLTASDGGAVVAPGEYGAIAQDDGQFRIDNPVFTGPIFDSSWGSLAAAGEEIGLIDASGADVEKFTYQPYANYSLERVNPFLSDYTGANWVEHASGNTLGNVNSVFNDGAATTTATTTVVINDTATTTASTATTTQGSGWEWIRINEIFPRPVTGEMEWVELFNASTTPFNLTGGSLCDGRAGACAIVATSGTIAGQGFAVFYLSSAHLNNDGDTVILKNPAGIELERVAYGGSLAPDTNQALARRHEDSPDFAITISPTPGTANVITPPAVALKPASGGSGGNSLAATSADQPVIIPVVYATTTSPLIITALLPAPKNSEDEFIAITNRDTHAVFLDNWQISDLQTSHRLSGEIASGATIIISRLDSRIALNNSGSETVRLITPANTIGDEVRYSSPPPDTVLTRELNWKNQAAPAAAAGAATDPKEVKTIAPIWRLSHPPFATINEATQFSALGTADPRGGLWQMAWDFGDGSLAIGQIVTHSFVATGTYTIRVAATSTAGTVGSAKLKVSVFARGRAPQVLLNEVFANPPGAETGEFVEIYNAGQDHVDISLWSLVAGTGKFIIPASTSIPAGYYRVFFRGATKLTLANASQDLTLLTNDNGVADTLRARGVPEGMSLARDGSTWTATETPTPGEPNIIRQVLGDKITAAPAAKKVEMIAAEQLADLIDLPNNERVAAAGLVSVLPGVFGSRVFYITDPSGSAEIYANKKNFPALQYGDRVRVVGSIGAGTEIPRIKIRNSGDVRIIGQGDVTANAVPLNLVAEDWAGAIVRIEGEITQVKKNIFYLDDGNGEIAVAIKPGTKIAVQPVLGGRASVTGMIMRGADGPELWPRASPDIALTAPQNASETEATGLPYKTYALAGLLGTALMYGAFKLRGRFAGSAPELAAEEAAEGEENDKYILS